MFPSFLHYLSLPPGSSEASRPGRKVSPRGVFHSVKHHQDFALLFGKRQMNVLCFFLMSSMEDKSYFLYFFVVFHGRKEVIIKKSFVSRERRIFFLHFLSSPMEENIFR